MGGKREMVQLAKTYNPSKHCVVDWFISEKLDGMRAWWDGGISRGFNLRMIPYANTAKDRRYVEQQPATGLWSRYGKPVYAPNWWLDRLPKGIALDGELFLDRGQFQRLRSIVSKRTPSARDWEEIRYLVFDMPNFVDLFMSGRIQAGPRDKQGVYGHSAEIDIAECQQFYNKVTGKAMPAKKHYTYLRALKELQKIPDIEVLSQTTVKTRQDIDEFLDKVLELGGEGAILRDPLDCWYPTRNDSLLKYKPYHDSEARVISHEPGAGKHKGRLGALRVEWNGKFFNIGTGFTDEERGNPPAVDSIITFRYRELTDVGIPKEARFLRQ